MNRHHKNEAARIEFRSIQIAFALGIALYLAGGVQTADADLTIDNGFLSAAEIKGAVRYRSFNSGGGSEVFVRSPDVLNPGCCTGANNDINYGAGSGQRTITFEYDGTVLKSVYQRGSGTPVTTSQNVGALGALNYLAFETMSSGGGASVVLQSVVVSKNGSPLNPNPALNTLGGAGSLQQRYAIGEDLTGNFKITANLNINGSPGGGDSHYVQIRVGHVPSADEEAPIVSNVHLSPPMPLLNGSADVEANVDDTGRGDSDIAAAEYQLNGGSWLDMDALDGAFDDVSEDVIATLGYLNQIGRNTVCVRGEDVHGNLSGLDPETNASYDPCLDFIVAYAFYGFYSPVDNDMLNSAKAGQAIPFKWHLQDAHGNPIADPDSFVGLYSYPIDCDTLTGNIVDAVEEYAPGSSGLQYNGDGYWQFNWKTLKGYASSCRAAYIELDSTQTSPVVTFMFKK